MEPTFLKQDEFLEREIWHDTVADVQVLVSRFRQNEDPVPIPGGDTLRGSTEEIRSQLARRGFVRLPKLVSHG